MNIFKQQKFTFKLIIEFSFLLIRIDNEGFDPRKIWDYNNYSSVDFHLRLASTNTRPEGFENPVVADNKKILIKLLMNFQIRI